ncbi:WD40 repeat domain-containing protein [Chloropicon primus]|nr:WD40 repeat domain-containing protein [Chloropicon primus]
MVLGISSTGHLVTDPVAKGTFFHPIGNGIRCVHGGELKDTTLLQGHTDVVNCVAISPNGACLASSQLGKHTDVILWDAVNLKKRSVLCVHDFGVQDLAFSHDGKLLASMGSTKDDRIYIWDTSTSNYVCNASLKGRSFESVSWRGSLDERTGSYVFVTCGNSGVFVWTVNPYTGSLSAPVECNAGSLKRHCTCCVFDTHMGSQDLFFCGTTSGDVLCYTYKSVILKHVFPVSKGRINTMVAVPQTDLILIGSEDQHVYAFDCRAGASNKLVQVESGIVSIALGASSGSEVHMFVSTHDCTIWGVTCTASGGRWVASEVAKLEENHSCAITCLTTTAATAAGNEYWFSSDTKGNICAWDSDCKMRLKLNLGYNGPKTMGNLLGQRSEDSKVIKVVTSMVQLPGPDGPTLLCGKSDGNIQLFSIQETPQGGLSLKSEWQVDQAHKDAVVTSVTCDGVIMASGSSHGEVKVWDFGTRRLVSSRKDHVSAVTGCELIQQGQVVVTISKDTKCKYYNWAKNISGVFFVMEASRLNGLCITRPDEQLLVSAGSDKYLTTWNLANTETVFSVQAHTQEATCLSLSPSNALVVTGGADRVLRVWGTAQGNLRATLEGHCGAVVCVKFLSEHKIISADDSGAIILWDCAGC